VSGIYSVVAAVLPLGALRVGERHLGQLLVGHDLVHLDGGELAAAELEAEPVGPRNDAAVGRSRAGGEVELADEAAVHGQAPDVVGHGRACGGALLRIVLAAVGAVGPHAAPAAVAVVVLPAVVGGVQPVQPFQVEIRVEEVVVAPAAVEVPAPSGLHLGRRQLVPLAAEVPGRDVAAGAPVRRARALLRRGVDADGLHAHVPLMLGRERLHAQHTAGGHARDARRRRRRRRHSAAAVAQNGMRAGCLGRAGGVFNRCLVTGRRWGVGRAVRVRSAGSVRPPLALSPLVCLGEADGPGRRGGRRGQRPFLYWYMDGIGMTPGLPMQPPWHLHQERQTHMMT
jgi:hypothetical protein